MRMLVLVASVTLALMLAVNAPADAPPPTDGGVRWVDWDGGQLTASVTSPWTIGAPASTWWGTCWLAIAANGDVRIQGTGRARCIEALADAVRLAKAEERVNRRRRTP